MQAYVYNPETSEIITVINGDSNEQIENFILPLIDTDTNALTYTNHGLYETNFTEHLTLEA